MAWTLVTKNNVIHLLGCCLLDLVRFCFMYTRREARFFFNQSLLYDVGITKMQLEPDRPQRGVTVRFDADPGYS